VALFDKDSVIRHILSQSDVARRAHARSLALAFAGSHACLHANLLCGSCAVGEASGSTCSPVSIGSSPVTLPVHGCRAGSCLRTGHRWARWAA
jgi:hypothetical protein